MLRTTKFGAMFFLYKVSQCSEEHTILSTSELVEGGGMGEAIGIILI